MSQVKVKLERKMLAQLFKFIMVGLSNTMISFLVYYICLAVFKYNYTVSLVISYVIGVLNSYIWHSRWTFASRGMNLTGLCRFIAVYILTFFVNWLVLRLAIEVMGMQALAGQAFSLCVATVFSFFSHKYWSFGTGAKSHSSGTL